MERRAFTLVELLVVVAIIALLLAMLMPALSKAARLAKSTACLSNQRQIGIALAMMVGEHRNRYPPAITFNEYDWMAPYVRQGEWRSWLIEDFAMNGTFACPNAFIDGDNKKHYTSNPSVMRKAQSNDKNRYRPLPSSFIDRASEIILFMDGAQFASDGRSTPDGRPDPDGIFGKPYRSSQTDLNEPILLGPNYDASDNNLKYKPRYREAGAFGADDEVPFVMNMTFGDGHAESRRHEQILRHNLRPAEIGTTFWK